jgi:cell division protein ZapA (FtsZ GTPase activity inhibitor)
METTLYEIEFLDGRKFRVFCYRKSQKQRFKNLASKLKDKTKEVKELTNGIHTLREFWEIMNNEIL